jgi:hypothetical protein
LYNANGDSPPNPKIEISREILIVQRLEIATINYFGAVPVSMPAVEPVGASIQETTPKMGHIAAAFRETSKLAMSDSGGMPHSRGSLDIRREELACTLLCNHGCIHPTNVHAFHRRNPYRMFLRRPFPSIMLPACWRNQLTLT